MIVLLKKVFMWDKYLCKRNWSYEIKQLFSKKGFKNSFMTNSCVNEKLMHDVLHQRISTTWNHDIFNVDQLRTYVTKSMVLNIMFRSYK